ncbi:MAG TPA: pitrilysin family protein [Xanthomonadaceae bacterium]|nr:pitrilysin family protein [Xanthomonadaceae bacterium]
MPKLLAALAVALAILLAASPADAQRKSRSAAAPDANRIFDMPYLMRDLSNGLRVIVVRTEYPDIVSLHIPVQTGSRNEVEEGKSGFAHFFEHMMFRGTEKYPPREYGAVMTAAGASQNAYTTDDFTNYHIDFTKADLEKILEVEADRFQNLKYSEEQFRTEAQAVEGEYLKNFSNPVQKLFERVRELAFTTHTYGHTTMGFFRDIKAMPDQMEYSKIFFDRWYRPEYSAVIVVGDVDPEETFKLVRKHFGSWRRGSFRQEIPVEPPQQAPNLDHVQWQGPTLPWIIMAYRAPAFDPDGHEMQSLNLLGDLYFGQTSALYQRLVVRERLADALFANLGDRKDETLMLIGARLNSAESAATVIEAIQDTLVEARTQALDPQRLAETKSRAKYSFANALGSSSSIAATLARFVQYERTPETLNQMYAQFDRVTPDDILAAANKWLVDRNRTTVTLSNDEAFAGIEALMDIDARVASAAAAGGPSIATLEMQGQSPLVNVALLFEAGSAYDPPGKKGLAMLTAGMIANAGSKSMSFAQIQQALYPLAAGFGAQVDKHMVRLSGSVHRDNLDAWYAIIRGQLLEPAFDEDDFKRVRQQQLNALRVNLRSNNDEELGKEVLYELAYGPDHPYGTLNLGKGADLEAITLDDVREFYTRHFTQARLTVSLAGGYPDAFRERLLADTARLSNGAANALDVPAPAFVSGRHATVVEKETPAVAVSFGFPLAVKRGDPDWVALWLARSWLGEHRSSVAHLYQRIREARGMNYGNYAYVEYFPNGMYLTLPEPNYARRHDLFQIWLRPLRDNNDAHFATRAAMHELQQLIEHGLSAEQFEAIRSFNMKYVAQLAGDQRKQLGFALDQRFHGIDGSFADYVRAGLESLSVDDFNAAVRRHLKLDDIQFVFIAKDAADLAARLDENRPSPMSYNSEKPAELLTEDETISVLDLGLSGHVTVRPVAEVFE